MPKNAQYTKTINIDKDMDEWLRLHPEFKLSHEVRQLVRRAMAKEDLMVAAGLRGAAAGDALREKAMQEHEARCFHNPDMRACQTCGHLRATYETVYDRYHYGDPGASDYDVKVQYCKVEIDIKESFHNMCPGWIPRGANYRRGGTMSIEALEYISKYTGMRIEACLDMVVEGATRSRCSVDDLSEAWCWSIRFYASPEEALHKVEELFNAGYDLATIRGAFKW